MLKFAYNLGRLCRVAGAVKRASSSFMPNAWGVVRRTSKALVSQGRADALNQLIRNLVARAPQQFRALRGQLGSTKAVVSKLYPPLTKALKQV